MKGDVSFRKNSWNPTYNGGRLGCSDSENTRVVEYWQGGKTSNAMTSLTLVEGDTA
jgi:hypothetical protein